MVRISDIVQQVKQGREETFFTNLMQYAMDNNTTMPNKTQLWNQYLSLKGGRLSAADITFFNSQYSNIKEAIYRNQLKELNKFSIAGESDRTIRKRVKDDPDTYKNLLDLISDAKASGTPEGAQMAAIGERFLPQPKGFEKWAEEGIPTWARVAGPLAAGGAVYGLSHLAGANPASIEARQAEKDLRKAYRKDIKDTKKSITKAEKKLKGREAKLKDLQAKRQYKTGKTTSKKVLDKAYNLVREQKDEIKSLKTNLADLKKDTPKGSLPKVQTNLQAMRQNLKGKIGPASTAVGAGALWSLPAIGEYLGGQEGQEVGRTASNLGLLGLAGRTAMQGTLPGRVASAAIYGLPAGLDLWNQITGDE